MFNHPNATKKQSNLYLLHQSENNKCSQEVSKIKLLFYSLS